MKTSVYNQKGKNVSVYVPSKENTIKIFSPLGVGMYISSEVAQKRNITDGYITKTEDEFLEIFKDCYSK